jgi:hypothetical protein
MKPMLSRRTNDVTDYGIKKAVENLPHLLGTGRMTFTPPQAISVRTILVGDRSDDFRYDVLVLCRYRKFEPRLCMGLPIASNLSISPGAGVSDLSPTVPNSPTYWGQVE